MAEVLAVVPQVRLEALLVAVDLVLEAATPNGSISVEHVQTYWGGSIRQSNPSKPKQHCN